MDGAKAHHLARGPWLRGRSGAIVVGDGEVALRIADLLGDEGIAARILGTQALERVKEKSEAAEPVWILCIRDERRRHLWQQALEWAGWAEGTDYFRFR